LKSSASHRIAKSKGNFQSPQITEVFGEAPTLASRSRPN
jgi:hypothetical protein